MLKPTYTKQFERDLKMAIKRGKNQERIKVLIVKLINEEPLEQRYKDHKFTDNQKANENVKSRWSESFYNPNG